MNLKATIWRYNRYSA